MRVLQQLALCFLVATGCAMAQRGGGGGHAGGGGGFHGGGSMGGGGFHGGGTTGGGFRGGGFSGGGFNRGVGGGFNGFRGGFGGFNGFRGGLGFRGYYGGYWGWPYGGWGYGLGYWPYWDSYPYDYGYYPYYDSTYSTGYSYPAYQQAPNTTVIYPPQSVDITPRPAVHEYDQYGQEVNPQGIAGSANAGSQPAGSPIYLIALKDKNIRAAAAYWVNGQTLHYVTLDHVEQQAPLADVDRDLSMRLNRERHVPFQLPQ